MDEIYTVINKNGEMVGRVFLNGRILKVTNKEFTYSFNNILEALYYLEANMLHINDMQGDLYSKEIHLEVIKSVEKIGIASIIRWKLDFITRWYNDSCSRSYSGAWFKREY